MDKEILEHVFQRPAHIAKDNYRMLCPFHDERTPSFYIQKDQMLAYCFGCGTGGDLDILVSKYLAVSVCEARKILGITVEDVANRVRLKKKIRTPVRYMPESWLAPYRQEVHQYILNRGFTVETLKEVDTRYDKKFKRQVFPHRSKEGKLLGLVGRACESQEPKWFIYWDYDKGADLYAPYGIDSSKPLIIVEGVFDVLWLGQNKIYNSAALLGSKETSRQVERIKDQADRVIIGLDNDRAGICGTEKLYRNLRKDTKVQFIHWPEHSVDWMDLSKEQIDSTLANTLTYVQRQVI